MEITITQMSPQDRDEIISMFRECEQSGDLVLDTDDPGTRDISRGRNLVARAQDRIIGWASVDPAGGKFKPGMASISVLVRPGYRRIGVGRALLNTAIDVAARSGIGTLVSGIVPRNVPALLLHKSCGFKAVGMMQKAGLAGGKWQDAVLLQRECSKGEAGGPVPAANT